MSGSLFAHKSYIFYSIEEFEEKSVLPVLRNNKKKIVSFRPMTLGSIEEQSVFHPLRVSEMSPCR